MKENIIKAKKVHKRLLILGLIVFISTFIYSTYFHDFKLIKQVGMSCFFISIVFYSFIEFYKDRIVRYNDNVELIDCWLFCVKNIKRENTWRDTFKFTFLFPLLKKQTDDRVETLRIRINYLIVLFYIFFLIFLITIFIY